MEETIYYCKICNSAFSALPGKLIRCKVCGTMKVDTNMPLSEWQGLTPDQKAAKKTEFAMLSSPELHGIDKVANLISQNKPEALLSLTGSRGRSITIYDDRCVIKVNVTAGSVLTGNATDGEKTIFYKDIVGIQFKESGITLGYLQLETSAQTMNNGQNNFFNENTFTFGPEHDVSAGIIKEYIVDRVSVYKK